MMSTASVASTHSGASSLFRQVPPNFNQMYKPSASTTHQSRTLARTNISSFEENCLFSSKPPSSYLHDYEISSDSDCCDDYAPPSYGLSQLNKLKNTSRIGTGRNAKRVSYDIFELEDKLSRQILDFNIYNDSDLPFLNDTKNEACNMMRKNIIVGEVDDDCQTDDDQRENAKNMLKDEIKSAINKFLADKKDGTVEMNIKNFNLKKRFSREPFNLPCTE